MFNYSPSSSEFLLTVIGIITLCVCLQVKDPLYANLIWACTFLPMIFSVTTVTIRLFTGFDQYSRYMEALRTLGGIRTLDDLAKKLVFARFDYGIVTKDGFVKGDREGSLGEIRCAA